MDWRLGSVLLLLGCTGAPDVPRNPAPLQLAVRVAESSHADEVEQNIFVWPTAKPQQAPSEQDCMWWSGDRRGRDVAATGLHEGRMRWAALVITRDSVQFAGETVATLDGAGRIPEDQLSDGVLVALGSTLREARGIQDAWYDACGLVYRDRPLLVVEQAVPATTVIAVLRTLSVHRFPRVAALVGDRKPENRSVDAPEDPGVLAVVKPDGDQVQVMDSLGLRRYVGKPSDMESMLAKSTPDARFGCALVVPEAGSSWRDVAATVDTVTAFGAFSALIHSEAEWTPGPEAASEAGRAPTEWLTLDGLAGVHWLDTPVLEEVWTPVTDAVRCDQVEGRVRQRIPVPATLRLALGSPGSQAVQPCLGPACVPLVQLPPEEGVELEPVVVDWQAYGGVTLPSPTEEAGVMGGLVEALQQCPPPTAVDERRLARAVGWVEVDPAGRAFDAQVGVLEEGHKVWAACLGTALQGFPQLPEQGEGQHAAVQLLIDAQLAPQPEAP